MLPQYIQPKSLCYCESNNHYDCNKELLCPIHPGQTMMLKVFTNSVGLNSVDRIITAVNNIGGLPSTACVITNSSEMVQIGKSHTCILIKVHYCIL